MPSRRSLLALAGGTIAALAGCTGRGTDPATATTTTDTTTTTTDVALEAVTVRRSIRVVGSAHWSVEPGLFVVAAFSAPGIERPHGVAAREVVLVLDGDVRVPSDRSLVENSQRPDAASVAFPVPEAGVDVTSGRVAWGERSWDLPERVLARLAAPPAFTVRRFEVPKTTPVGEDVTATLTVENVGGSDGRLLAELGSSALSDRPEVTVEVPAGERVTRQLEVNVVTYEPGGIRVVLDRGDDRLERPVTLTDESG